MDMQGKDIKDWEIKSGILKILHVVSIELGFCGSYYNRLSDALSTELRC